jgi:hypothetical protein
MLYEIYINEELVGVQEDLNEATVYLTEYVQSNGISVEDNEFLIAEVEGVMQ